MDWIIGVATLSSVMIHLVFKLMPLKSNMTQLGYLIRLVFRFAFRVALRFSIRFAL